ncbi:restriction endonuclease subunit S [Mycolicibacterium sp.]|uniref:restriction endonuclease subunit S n=1 Tax=Mycolicibacterium sp. TaxID=2320850 RepID=UPI0025DFD4C4|nr:restriction endonuclease subunit S [Mycolicibacterium sp.]
MTKPLGELFAVAAGKTMSAAARSGENKVPFLRTSNVMWDEIDLSEVDEMAIPEQELAAKLVEPGDLLVCEGGEIGRAAIWEGGRTPISFQNHLHRLRPIADDVDPRFYVYFLQSAFTQLGLFEGAGNRTTIPNLSSGRLKALDVPHPPFLEQVAIADSLKYVQRARHLNARLIATTEELRAATMQRLFSQGLRGERLKETELGPVPESWDVSTINDVALQTQYGLSIRGQAEGAIPILRMNCQDDGRVRFRDLQYVDLDEATLSAFRLEDGDLLFNRTNSIEHVGRTAIFDGVKEAVFASYLVRLKVDTLRCLPRFLNYYMNRREVQQDIKRLASRAVGQANINATKLRTIAFPLPPSLNEQAEIIAILDALDRKLDLHRRKREVLDQLFKSLLYKLMTGEISVYDLDLSALPANDGSAA